MQWFLVQYSCWTVWEEQYRPVVSKMSFSQSLGAMPDWLISGYTCRMIFLQMIDNSPLSFVQTTSFHMVSSNISRFVSGRTACSQAKKFCPLVVNSAWCVLTVYSTWVLPRFYKYLSQSKTELLGKICTPNFVTISCIFTSAKTWEKSITQLNFPKYAWSSWYNKRCILCLNAFSRYKLFV